MQKLESSGLPCLCCSVVFLNNGFCRLDFTQLYPELAFLGGSGFLCRLFPGGLCCFPGPDGVKFYFQPLHMITLLFSWSPGADTASFCVFISAGMWLQRKKSQPQCCSWQPCGLFLSIPSGERCSSRPPRNQANPRQAPESGSQGTHNRYSFSFVFKPMVPISAQT